MRSHTIDLDGPVHYVDFGGAGPAVVLVHGLAGSHANWLAVGAPLARHARVLALDLAGFGRTPPAGRAATLAANRALLGRFLERVVGEPAVLVGNSMGGLLSVMQAAVSPEAVAALVLVNPSLPAPPGVALDRQVAAIFAAYMVPWLGAYTLRRRVAALGVEGVVRETLRLCCADASQVPAEVVAAMVALAHERRAFPWADDAVVTAARSIVVTLLRRRRFETLLRAVRAPTLLVHGTDDRLVPLAASRAAAQLRPDWTLAVLDGVGHVPQLEVPERFVATVTGWLGGVERLAATGAAS